MRCALPSRQGGYVLRGIVVIGLLMSIAVAAFCWWQLLSTPNYASALAAGQRAQTLLAPTERTVVRLSTQGDKSSLVALGDDLPILSDTMAEVAPHSSELKSSWDSLRRELSLLARNSDELAGFERAWVAFRSRIAEALNYLPELDQDIPNLNALAQSLIALDRGVDRWRPVVDEEAGLKILIDNFIVSTQGFKPIVPPERALVAVGDRLAQNREALFALLDLYQISSAQLTDVEGLLGAVKAELANTLSQLEALQDDRAQLSLTGWSALIALLVLGPTLFLMVVLEERRLRRQQQAEAQQREKAILALLDEFSRLADGDLTASAKVTEDVTGALADAFNFAVSELSHLVKTLDHGTQEVRQAVKRGRGAAGKMLEVGERQRRVIEQAAKSAGVIAERALRSHQAANDAASRAVESLEKAEQQSVALGERIANQDNIKSSVDMAKTSIARVDFSVESINSALDTVESLVERSATLAINAGIQADKSGHHEVADLAMEIDAISHEFRRLSQQVLMNLTDVQRDAVDVNERLDHTLSFFSDRSIDFQGARTQVDQARKVLAQVGQAINQQLELLDQQRNDTDELLDQIRTLQSAGQQSVTVARDTAYEVARLSQVAAQWQASTERFKLPQQDEND